ncbi:MAG: hypothetical protein N2450_02275 [bacterium]|nr:hypothetical protein [bacterium]
MNREHFFCFLIFLTFTSLFYLSCEQDDNVVSETSVTLAGRVVDARTNRGIPDANVRTAQFPETGRTDSNGDYVFTIITGDSFQAEVDVIASAAQYIADTISIMARSGRRIELPTFQLRNIADTPDTNIHTGPSGPPSSILFIGSNVPSIGVRETGIVEAMILTYEVRDNRGVPVDLNNRTTVRFRIEGSTGGGEYLGNDTAVTDINGRVSCSIISGIRPGTVQVVASCNDTIVARPVRVTIHSGPPDSLHTTIGFDRINFPGLDWVARIDTVMVLIGDRYSNPVPAGTRAYFSSDHGVIQGMGITNDNGIAWVLLFSGNPYPPTGWSYAHVQTVDWTGNSYSVSGRLLWSGVIGFFQVTPTSFTVANRGSQAFEVYLADWLNHPLSRGTTFKVSATVGVLTGDVDLVFPDTQSDGWTRFYFTLSDDDPNEAEPPKACIISIETRGLNGNAIITASGTVD